MINKIFTINNNKINIIKTNKFKSISILFRFKRPITKEEVTINKCLIYMLGFGSKNYDSKRKIGIKLQDLYSAHLNSKIERNGNYLMNNLYLNIFNDKYTEEGNLEEAIKFISDIIYNPDIKDKSFSKDKLKVVKKKIYDEIINIKENSSHYSTIKLAENYNDDNININTVGYLDDLDKINEVNLYEYYLDFINNNNLEIYVCGDFDYNITELFNKYIKSSSKEFNIDYFLDIKKYNEINEYKEDINNNQSYLSIFCNVEELNSFERVYVMMVYNYILGGGPDSKFFKNIREENSLCYTIYSNYIMTDQVLLIKSGINKDNYKKTIQLIEKNMNDMTLGNFSDSDINTAKELFLSYCDEMSEFPSGIINDYVFINDFGFDEIEKRKELIKKVSKEDIINLSKKIKLDTIFLLEGVLNGKD